MSAAEYRHDLPLKNVHVSQLNPRKHLDPEKLKELTDSVKAHGVLQPILVRPLTVAGSAKTKDFEIVFGERRYHAALAAGLDVIPATVREMNDREVVEAALLENAQRADVHPLEQADALKELHQTHGISTDELAVKMGKSVRWVQSQLQLTKLVKEARDAFFKNDLNPSVALLIARIPNEKLQKEALAEIARGRFGEPYSYRDVLHLISQRYMLQLKDAPFSPKDAQLCPEAGACTACPKRTGAQPDLFNDIQNKDVCTDPPCFRKKSAAHREQLLATAKAEGRKVIEGAEAKKVFPEQWSQPQGYVALDMSCHEDPKYRTYGKVLGKKADAEKVLVVNPHTKKVVELLPEKKVKELLKEVGIQSRPSPSSSYDQQRKKQLEQAKFRGRVVDQTIASVVAQVEKTKPTIAFWRLLVEGLLVTDGMDVAERRGFEDEKALKKAVEKMNEDQLRGLVFEVVAHGAWAATYNGYEPRLKEIAGEWGVSLQAIESEAKAAEKQKAKKPAKKKAEVRA